MSPNPYDQFDSNPYDQFDTVKTQTTRPSIMENFQAEQARGNQNYNQLDLGMLKGASNIGSTILSPLDWVAKRLGVSNSFIGRENRRQDITSGLQSMGADTSSVPYQAGKIGAEIAGTSGIPGALAKGVLKVAPTATNLASALATGGLSSGEATGIPAMALRELGGVVTGGTMAGAVNPENAKTGAIVGAALPPVAYAGGKALDVVKGLAKNTLGMTTGAGGQAIEEAYKAGKAGGLQDKAFVQNMRGKVPMEDVLNSVDQNIQAMGQAKSQAYKEAMAKMGKDQTVLDFGAINKAAQDAMKVQTFTGPTSGMTVSTARSTLPMQKKIADLVNEWQKLPSDFHTASGLDALKKNIGDLRDSSAFGTPERLVADKVYNAVKNQIVKQAPEYANTMKDYQQASDLLSEIRSTLSNKPTASVDTQMRKLQSLMRNNVNTNYGNRLGLVNKLEQAGGHQVIPAIAGQALNTIVPRGLQSATTIPTAIGGAMLGGIPTGAAMLPLASPRLMGESARGAGLLASIINKQLQSPIAKGLLYNPSVLDQLQ